nr:unnamed protein product [Callosobruchus analis]
MYAAGVGAFLRKLIRILYALAVRMYNNDGGPKVYAFRAFRFEKIKPSSTSKVPFPRSGHRIAADSANFYSFGGYNPLARDFEQDGEDDEEVAEREHGFLDGYWIQTLFQELWKFNYASAEWTRYSNGDTMPMELASNALLLHKNILMVYGGTGTPFGFRSSNQLYTCRVNDNEGLLVEVNTTGQHPLPLYGQALIFYNDYLYTIGGTTGQTYTCDIHRLNLKSMNWEIVYLCNGQGEYEPKGRYRHEVGFDGRHIYVLGGGTIIDAFGFKDIPAFDVEDLVWRRKKTVEDPKKGYPPPRRCHGAVQVDAEEGGGAPQVFVIGGHDGENIFDDLWRLDLRTFRWTCFDTCRLPRPMYFHAAAVSPQGRLYVFGGNYSVNDDIRRSNAIYSTWVCVPKLAEMCWEAVLHYSPNINRCRTEDLIDSGLPRHFVQRLGGYNTMCGRAKLE